MNQQEKKKHLFFKEWKISPENLLAKNVPVTVPHGTTVNIDGIPLKESYLVQMDNATDTYTLPKIFAGEHRIEVSMPGMETVNEVFNPGWNGYYLYEMQISQSTLQELLGQAEEDMGRIYGAAFHNNGFSAISDLFVSSQKKSAEIEASYKDFTKEIKGNDYGKIETLDIKNITGEAYDNSGEGICAAVDISFDYQITYSELNSWDRAGRKNIYEGRDGLIFYYVLENGKWRLENLGCHSLYH